MTRNEGPSAERVLVTISFVADVAGILAYLGFNDNRDVRIILGAALALVALFAGGITAVSAARAWLGPRGAYRPSTYHRNNFLAAVAALFLAVLLAVATLHVVTNPQNPSHRIHASEPGQLFSLARERGPEASLHANISNRCALLRTSKAGVSIGPTQSITLDEDQV